MAERVSSPVRHGRAKVPVVMQMEAPESGAACLAMILAYYGKWVPLEQVRADCGVSRDGSNAKNILRAARSYGLEASGWRYEPESLREEGSFPCIVHWNFNHFIVLDGFKGDRVYVNDPARGSCVMSFEEFDRGFTGICLAFEPGEGFTPGGKPKSVFAYAAARLRGVAFVTLTTVISALIGIINPAFSRVFLDRLLTGVNPDWFMPFILGITALGVVQIAVAWVQAVYSLKINGKLAALGSTEFMWKVLRLPMEFFAQRVAGDIQSRKDTNAGIANTIVNTLAPLALNMAMMVFYLAVMLRYSPMLTLVGITGIVVNLLVSRLISKKRIDIARLQTRDAGRLAGATVSGIEMIETIKSAGAENGWFERWAGYQASVNTQEARFSRLNNYLGLVPKIAASAANTVVLMLGVWLTVQGEFTAGMIMAFQGFLASFTAPAAQLITSGQTIQEMRTQMEQVEDVLSYRTDPNWRDDPVAEGAEYDKLSGAVELRHVTFGYSRFAEPLIEDFSLSLRPGSRVALVGASGCGKSTMAKLVSGLYEPWSGEILFDGRPIKEIDRSVFTGSLAVVDQDIILFEDTVSANVKMWDSSIEDFEVILAARDAEIHETVMQRDGGCNAHVSEGGRDFSGGERQRLEIARVLAQDPTIVILDEALASVTGGAGKRGGGHVLCPYCMSELVASGAYTRTTAWSISAPAAASASRATTTRWCAGR